MIEYIEENGKVVLDIRGKKKIHVFENEADLIDIDGLVNWVIYEVLSRLVVQDGKIKPRKSEFEYGYYTLLIKFYDNTTYSLSLVNGEMGYEAIFDEDLKELYSIDSGSGLLYKMNLRDEMMKAFHSSFHDVPHEITDSKEFLSYIEERWKRIGFDMRLDEDLRVIKDGTSYSLPLDQCGSGVNRTFHILLYLFCHRNNKTPELLWYPMFFTSLDLVRRKGIEKIIEEEYNGKLLTTLYMI